MFRIINTWCSVYHVQLDLPKQRYNSEISC